MVGDSFNRKKCQINLQELGKALEEYATRYYAYPDADGDGQADTGRRLLEDLRTLGPAPPLKFKPDEASRTQPGARQSYDDYFVCPLTEKTPGPGVITYKGPGYSLEFSTPYERPVARDDDGDHPDGTIHVLYRVEVRNWKPGMPKYEWEAREVKPGTSAFAEAKRWCP